jgi:hypothetical protein
MVSATYELNGAGSDERFHGHAAKSPVISMGYGGFELDCWTLRGRGSAGEKERDAE